MSEARRVRLVALVGAVQGERRAFHTGGYPLATEKMLPLPDVLLVDTEDGPGVMLYRYTAHGEFGGDTMHSSVDAAKDQASFEYREALGEWIEVPADVADAHRFAVQYAASHLRT
jgi:hypothetical protein